MILSFSSFAPFFLEAMVFINIVYPHDVKSEMIRRRNPLKWTWTSVAIYTNLL